MFPHPETYCAVRRRHMQDLRAAAERDRLARLAAGGRTPRTSLLAGVARWAGATLARPGDLRPSRPTPAAAGGSGE